MSSIENQLVQEYRAHIALHMEFPPWGIIKCGIIKNNLEPLSLITDLLTHQVVAGFSKQHGLTNYLILKTAEKKLHINTQNLLLHQKLMKSKDQ